MATHLHPYLNFRNTTRAAMEFYQSVFGGKLDIHTFKEYQATQDPKEENNVMHAMLVADNGISFMASDVPSHLEYKPGNTMSMSLSGENETELRGYWQKLSQGATVIMPLEPAPWGDTFGMLVDTFGTQWMVNILGKKA